MRPYAVTLFQTPEKFELAMFFYGEILGLPDGLEIGEGCVKFFSEPVHLAVQLRSPSDNGAKTEGFSGVQLNYVPGKDLNPIVAKQRATGLAQPEPREVGDSRILSVHDPSGNILMLVGTDVAPDEPTVETAVGSVTVFVSDFEVAHSFYSETLKIPVRAEPHPGLLVLGGETGTAILVYKVEAGAVDTPIGRTTGLAFATDDITQAVDDIRRSLGEIVDLAEGLDGIRAATFSDPEGNVFTLLSEQNLADVPVAVEQAQDEDAEEEEEEEEEETNGQ